eukprot:Gb_09458 [translate_table: standard]
MTIVSSTIKRPSKESDPYNMVMSEWNNEVTHLSSHHPGQSTHEEGFRCFSKTSKQSIARRILRLDATLTLLEAKLKSVDGVEEASEPSSQHAQPVFASNDSVPELARDSGVPSRLEYSEIQVLHLPFLFTFNLIITSLQSDCSFSLFYCYHVYNDGSQERSGVKLNKCHDVSAQSTLVQSCGETTQLPSGTSEISEQQKASTVSPPTPEQHLQTVCCV